MVQKICKSPTHNRRAIRPIDREKMKPWLIKRLDGKTVNGLQWVDREKNIFQVTWRHASHHQYATEDSNIFKCWAEHTGKFRPGDEINPKKWKANFRCALNSLKGEISELKEQSVTRGGNAVRIYKFLDGKSSGKQYKKAKTIPDMKTETMSDDDDSTSSSCSDQYESVNTPVLYNRLYQDSCSLPDFAKIDPDLDVNTTHVKTSFGGGIVKIKKEDSKIIPIICIENQSIPLPDQRVPCDIFENTDDFSFEECRDDRINDNEQPLISEDKIQFLEEVVLDGCEDFENMEDVDHISILCSMETL